MELPRYIVVPSMDGWSLDTVAQLRLDESALSADEQWGREGPCSTVRKKRQGLRTKTHKRGTRIPTYILGLSYFQHVPLCCTTTLLRIGNVIWLFFSMFPFLFPSALPHFIFIFSYLYET